MRPVEVVLTDELCLKARLAIDELLARPDEYVMDDEERHDFERLAVFFGYLVEHPQEFPPTGRMAAKIKANLKPPKQPRTTSESTSNARKRRQERRQGGSKRRRAEAREYATAYNEARARMEAELAEAEEAHAALLARLEGQAKFSIVAADGQVLLEGVPEEFIRDEDGEPAKFRTGRILHGDNEAPEIIVPGRNDGR